MLNIIGATHSINIKVSQFSRVEINFHNGNLRKGGEERERLIISRSWKMSDNFDPL